MKERDISPQNYMNLLEREVTDMKKALIIVDMQNDFVTGCLGTNEAQEVIPKIKEYADAFDGDIYFTMDTHRDDYLDTQEGKRLPVKHCVKDSDGWLIVPELRDIKDVQTFEKPVFGSRELAEKIAEKAYDEVYLCGVCTGICVLSNAILIKAFDADVRVAVVKELCACVTPDTHKTALDAMATAQIDII